MSKPALRTWAVGTAVTGTLLGATLVVVASPASAAGCTYGGKLYPNGPCDTGTGGTLGGSQGCPDASYELRPVTQDSWPNGYDPTLWARVDANTYDTNNLVCLKFTHGSYPYSKGDKAVIKDDIY